MIELPVNPGFVDKTWLAAITLLGEIAEVTLIEFLT